jgi:hypothetical protein
MQPRTYTTALSAFGLSLFLAVAGANLAIDPMGVFGTKLLPTSANGNDRYLKLAEYQSHAERYSGLAFGSSRLAGISLDDLSQQFDGTRFANFSVIGGTLTDHLAVLKYVLHRRAASIKQVFILLDADGFGRRPFTDESLSFAMPPALSGENPFRFWWRNLTAIQFRIWRSALREGFSPTHPFSPTDPAASPTTPSASPSDNPATESAAGTLEAWPPYSPLEATALEKVTARPLYSQHLELWKRFVDLCRDNGIDLIVAISPLSRVFAANFDSADLSAAIDDIVRLAPAWDFTGDDFVSDDPRLWNDPSHFGPEVGRMMTDRMFGRQVPAAWSDFGQLRTRPRLATTRAEE